MPTSCCRRKTTAVVPKRSPPATVCAACASVWPPLAAQCRYPVRVATVSHSKFTCRWSLLMIRVCLVDDQTLVRQGVRSLLALSDDIIEVVGEAADGRQAWNGRAACRERGCQSV